MRSNRKIIFGLLLILGAFGFYRLFVGLTGARRPAPTVATANTSADPNLQTVSTKNMAGRVAEARVDIPANSIVTPDMLRMVPNGSTEGYVTDIDSQATGFVTRVDIPVGGKPRIGDKFGMGGDFVGHVSETGIAGLLQPGMRAMIIPIANKPTLHDLVRIGNHVDVLAAFDGQESRTLVENVRVLGVDVSANDYPNVNAAMRGPFKADAKQNGIRTEEDKAAAPAGTPTPAPNAGRPDPALTLEVTPRQAASLQLALASNATLDYLVRPAIPGNRSNEVAPVEGNGTNNAGTAQAQTVSVTKPQIAPYSSRLKAAGGGTGKGASNNGGSTNSGGFGNTPPIRPIADGPPFPPTGPITPAIPEGSLISKPPHEVFSNPVPTPTQNYSIPVYGDGKILRTETVPLPDPSR